jgi:hypothetical protein
MGVKCVSWTFDNGVMRKRFGPLSKVVGIFHYAKLYNFDYSPNIRATNEIDGTFNTYRKDVKCIENFNMGEKCL